MSDIRWEGFTHEEIYARVQQGPGRLASADAETAWSTVGATIRAVDEQLARTMKQIGVDWQGPAADRAHGGLTALSAWARDAADNATLTTDGIAAQAAGAQHVRDAMPPPHRDLDTAIALAGAGSYAPRATNVGALEDQMVEDRALAVDLMNRYTSDSSTHQEMMNYWTQPPSVVVETVAPGTAPSPGAQGGAVGRAAHAVAAGLAAASAATAARGAASTTVSGPAGLPHLEGAGAPESPTTRGTPSPSEPSRVPEIPGALLPSTSLPGSEPARPGSTVPGTRSPASQERLPGPEPPPGGVRQVVPRVPTRAGAPQGPLDAPWNAPSTRPVHGVIAGGRGGGSLPRTGDPAEVPTRGGSRGTGARAVVGGPADETVLGRPPGTAEPGTAPGHGILPFGGTARAVDQEHRRPGYLVDDTDAFADDRWFPPPVISADDPERCRV